jgi:hypothetical protein
MKSCWTVEFFVSKGLGDAERTDDDLGLFQDLFNKGFDAFGSECAFLLC